MESIKEIDLELSEDLKKYIYAMTAYMAWFEDEKNKILGIPAHLEIKKPS